MGNKLDPVEIARAGVEHARKNALDLVIIDTAGRLHIDEQLMEELRRIKAAVSPTEILLTVDAMLGQDAVNVAKTFHELLDITGVVLTKMDGGTGEKLDAIELFHPDRMASRILGMGDVLSLIERAEAAFDQKQAEELEKKMLDASFTLDDFLAQFKQLRKMGNLDQLLAMMPGVNTGAIKNANIDEKQMARTEAIILSMTRSERNHPEIINGSRRKRIAAGSGTTVEDVNRLLRQFEQTKKMMKQFSSMEKKGGRGFFGLGKGKMKIPF